MRAVIRLEAIGDNLDAYGKTANKMARAVGVELGYKSTQPWVARIMGTDPKYHFARKFMHSERDYSKANSNGSRGVFLIFTLEDGIYEVFEHLSWKRDRRYFIQVEEAKYHEISREEVERQLAGQGSSPQKP